VTWGSDSYQDPVTGNVLTGLLNAPPGRPFKAVDARLLYSIALHDNGTLYGWGHGAQGTNVLEGWTPTRSDPDVYFVPGRTFAAIAAGNTHVLAILPNSAVTGWGNDSGGALQAPARVRFRSISAGWGFSVGFAQDGTLWGWGTPVKSPFASQSWTFASLGWRRHGESDHYYVPRLRFRSVAAAAFHIMAIVDDS